jgi:hypothetical protein
LIPTHLVKKELKIKEVILNKNRNEVKEWKGQIKR